MQDRIKELAIEAGLIDCVNDHGQLIIDRGPYNDELTRFAKLVAEDCAKHCDSEGLHMTAIDIRARFGIKE